LVRLFHPDNWKVYDNTAAITGELGLENISLNLNRKAAPTASQNLKERREWFRAYRIEDYVSGLAAVRNFEEGKKPEIEKEEITTEIIESPKQFMVLSRRELVPNTYEFVIYAHCYCKESIAGAICDCDGR
jgi:hypothetical protein